MSAEEHRLIRYGNWSNSALAGRNVKDSVTRKLQANRWRWPRPRRAVAETKKMKAKSSKAVSGGWKTGRLRRLSSHAMFSSMKIHCGTSAPDPQQEDSHSPKDRSAFRRSFLARSGSPHRISCPSWPMAEARQSSPELRIPQAPDWATSTHRDSLSAAAATASAGAEPSTEQLELGSTRAGVGASICLNALHHRAAHLHLQEDREQWHRYASVFGVQKRARWTLLCGDRCAAWARLGASWPRRGPGSGSQGLSEGGRGYADPSGRLVGPGPPSTKMASHENAEKRTSDCQPGTALNLRKWMWLPESCSGRAKHSNWPLASFTVWLCATSSSPT